MRSGLIRRPKPHRAGAPARSLVLNTPALFATALVRLWCTTASMSPCRRASCLFELCSLMSWSCSRADGPLGIGGWSDMFSCRSLCSRLWCVCHIPGALGGTQQAPSPSMLCLRCSPHTSILQLHSEQELPVCGVPVPGCRSWAERISSELFRLTASCVTEDVPERRLCLAMGAARQPIPADQLGSGLFSHITVLSWMPCAEPRMPVPVQHGVHPAAQRHGPQLPTNFGADIRAQGRHRRRASGGRQACPAHSPS